MRTMEVLARYLKARRLRPATVRIYRDVMVSLAGYSEEWPVSGVVVDEWIAGLKMAEASVRHYFLVGNLLGRYMEKAYKVENPFKDANRPKKVKLRRRIFSSQELVAIISACANEQEKALVAVLIDSGCRIGELVGITVDNVADRWLNVMGKTGERRYRLAPELCEKLREMGAGGGVIFKMVDGSPATVAAINLRVRRVVQRAGVKGKKLGPHTFRHTSGSMVARATGSVLAVKALLQHDDIDTSMVYIHDVEDEMVQGVSPLGLLGEEIARSRKDEGKQVALLGDGSSQGLGEVEGEFVEMVEDNGGGLFEDMFPEIEDGREVRPLLKTEDLRLLRRVFITYADMGGGDDVARCSKLLRRVTRRQKVAV